LTYDSLGLTRSAAWLPSTFHNDYRALFISAIAFVFIGTFLVLPIESVR